MEDKKKISRKEALHKLGDYSKFTALTAMGTFMILNPQKPKRNLILIIQDQEVDSASTTPTATTVLESGALIIDTIVLKTKVLKYPFQMMRNTDHFKVMALMHLSRVVVLLRLLIIV